MKKIAILCLVLVMLVSCAIVKRGADMFCNPTEAQKAVAQSAIVFIDTILMTIDPTSRLFTEWTQAKMVFTLIRAGTCVTYAQLQDALDMVDQADLVAKGQAAMAGRPPVMKPDMTLLRDVLNK